MPTQLTLTQFEMTSLSVRLFLQAHWCAQHLYRQTDRPTDSQTDRQTDHATSTRCVR